MGCTPSLKSSKVGQCTCNCKSVHIDEPKLPRITKKDKLQLSNFKDDPRLPLTGRQVYLLHKSWKVVARNMVSTGINMFLSLFERHESIRNYFGMISDEATLAELRESGVLEDHARTVMVTIDEAIMSMNDVDMLHGMLKHIAKTHIRIAHFDPQMFLLIKDPFLLAVKETLEDSYSAHLAHIYSIAITCILDTLVQGFHEGRDQMLNGTYVQSTEEPD